MSMATDKTHPNGRPNPFALEAGDVLIAHGRRHVVEAGFDRDPSACWKQSRWVRCTRLPSHPREHALTTYVNPAEARLEQDADSEAAIWLQRDAEHLYRWARQYAADPSPGQLWVACKVQENAAYSARLARERMGVA
jgi:hypothetical protein